MSAMKTTANSALRYLRLNRVDIFEQLRLEELLLRKCSQNYFIFNQVGRFSRVCTLEGSEPATPNPPSSLPLSPCRLPVATPRR